MSRLKPPMKRNLRRKKLANGHFLTRKRKNITRLCAEGKWTLRPILARGNPRNIDYININYYIQYVET